MNFKVNERLGMPSCTKTVTIRLKDNIIKLKQNREVTVNSQDIVRYPYSGTNFTIRVVSSIFLVGTYIKKKLH